MTTAEFIASKRNKQTMKYSGEELERMANDSKATGIIKVKNANDLIRHLRKK